MDLLRQNSTTREDLGMLAVMDAVAADARVTQRELARQTGLNLKKVNYCLRRLLDKGHVKFQRAAQNPDKRAYLYILTPAGLKAKTQLTYRFVQFTLDFYGQVEARVDHRLAAMARAGVRSVVLLGATEAARIVLDLAPGRQIQVVGVLDGMQSGERFRGVPVIQEEDLTRLDWDALLLTALDEAQTVDVILHRLALPAERIWQLA